MRIISLLESKLNIDKENDEKLKELFRSSSPQLILLVGLPGSGKSTFVNNYKLKKHGIVASTDNILDQMAKDNGIFYNEAFKKFDFKIIDNQMKQEIKHASSKNERIL
jgi:GTPase SAR1 family protein